MNIWGADYSEVGFFPKIGKDANSHFFGGANWSISLADANDPPLLLLDLDLNDPQLSSKIESANRKRLPILSIVNSFDFSFRQEYVFCSKSKSVKWIAPSVICNPFPEEDRLPIPIAQLQIEMYPMNISDCPTTEDNYWAIGEEFLGGSKFIRIFGSPYWLQSPVTEYCPCGKQMTLAVSIGHEAVDGIGRFSVKPFFIGESALYFFVCWICCRVHVLSQST